MFKMKLLVLAIVSLLNLSEGFYDEKHRPQLHYSPPRGWMNDPNGLTYYNGSFHLFYQHNPKDTVFGPIHWGHAVSSDLVHWRTLPIALHPEKNNSIFSGSAIVDTFNVTGLQKPKSSHPPLITVFTAHSLATGEQKQWMAYSNDAPYYERFDFYKNNPIVANPNPSKMVDFRDPQVFQYKNYYVLVLVAANRTLIYNSMNLTNWTLASEFGERDGSHKGVWECPSMFPINVTVNGKEIEKWILIISVGPDMQYFVGSFNGTTFRNENSQNTELWVDYGPDTYAGITYNLLPDKRRIFSNWMSRWEYAQTLNYSTWNGQMGIARELKLVAVKDQFLLSSLPVREFNSLRAKHVHTFKNVTIGSSSAFKIGSLVTEEKEKHLLDIELTVNLTQFESNDSLGIEFAGAKEKLSILFTGKEFVLDRSNASNAGKNSRPNWGTIWRAPRHLSTPLLKLRIILDRSSIELFADDGLSVMAALYYSEEDLASNINISVKERAVVNLLELNVYQLESIWKHSQAP